MVLSLSAVASPQSPVPREITDSDAYAVYSALLPSVWQNVSSKAALLIRQETVFWDCGHALKLPDAAWQATLDTYRRENDRVATLFPRFSLATPYRLIAPAAIQADDARLAALYPGLWQRRPGSMEYAVVSIVAFNPTKTRAVLYMGLSQSGSIHFVEKQDGQWRPPVSAEIETCGWIA